jgi:hypothetical protein
MLVNARYSSDEGTATMSTEYRIQRAGSAFTVVDPWQEVVGTYATPEDAAQDIERCEKEDAMWESATTLVNAAVEAHMEMHGVDRETAVYWINSALGGT